MSNEFSITTGQAHELAQAFGRNGWSNQQVKKLSEGDFLKQVLDVLLGRAEIKPIENSVDLSADPIFLPDCWSTKEHQRGKVSKIELKGEGLYLNDKRIELCLFEEQKIAEVSGYDIREKLKGKLVLNANLLDYLLKHQNLIPETWKEDESGNIRYIYFWGTVYDDGFGHLCVRCLYWKIINCRWEWNIRYLSYHWSKLDWAICQLPGKLDFSTKC